MLIEAVSEEARHWPFPTAQIALHLGAFALLHMFLQFTALYLSNKSHETTKRSSGKTARNTPCAWERWSPRGRADNPPRPRELEAFQQSCALG